MEVWIAVGVGGGLVLAALVVVVTSVVRVDAGKALVVNRMGRTDVHFTNGLVLPIVHKGELLDISVKTIAISRRGKDGIVCRDNIRADLVMQFFVRVNRTHEDVLKVAQSIGCARAGDQATLEELFVAKFAEAIKTVAKQFDFAEIYRRRDEFRDRVIDVIGQDLAGYVLDDVALDYLEQTPLDALDPHNILDAEGIKKIVEITSEQRARQAEIEVVARQRRHDLEVLVAELEYRKADVLGRFKRDHGRELTDADLQAKIGALLVEHFGPRIDGKAAKALVEADREV